PARAVPRAGAAQVRSDHVAGTVDGLESDHQSHQASRVSLASRIGGLFRRLPVAATASQSTVRPEAARWDDQWSAVDPSTWLEARRASGRLYADLADDALAELRARVPGQAAHVIAAADRILKHEFDLLGSGPYVPVDPGRARSRDYVPIDWYLDPITRLRFP